MAGGTFSAYNKVIPGAYINFVSTKANVQATGQRGFVALPISLDYMPAGVTQLTASEFNSNSLYLFGVGSGDATLQPIREAFQNANTVLLVSSNSGATKASGTNYTAKGAGLYGNNISVVVENGLPSGFIMSVRYNGAEVERFRADALAGFINTVNSRFITIKTGAIIAVGTETLAGGTAGTETVSSYTAALAALELEYWNVLACISTTATVSSLVEAYIRRLRDEQGKKVTAVLHNYVCDYEGISVLNAANNKLFVPWVAGAMAAVPLNRSLSNILVTSEIAETHVFTYAEMEQAIKGGLFTIVQQGHNLRVLKDVNSMRTVGENKSALFSNNQIVRIIDQIGNDTLSILTNNFIGVVPNDDEGRAALWNAIVSLLNDMQAARAIQNFKSDTVVVVKGSTADSVNINCVIEPVGAIESIYMTVAVI